MSARVGIIGVGEAGAAIAAGLRETHGVTVAGHDAKGDDPAVRQRAERAGVELVDELPQLVDRCDVVICLTSAKVALPIARDVAALLGPRHVYTDWNSASPEVKRQVGEVIAPTGAAFADGAVMAAVPPHRHRVPVLLSGDGAERLATELSGYDMQLEVIGRQPGQASAVKMFRSLLVKGLEALVLECAVGARSYGATERVLQSMNGSLPTEDWPRLAAYLLERTVEHGERRAEELRQVASTLQDAGVEPLMADAGARRLQWFVDLGVSGQVDPKDYDGVLAAVEKARS